MHTSKRCSPAGRWLLFWIGAFQLAASPILTLNPSSGNLSGVPGALAGWGFTITNDSGYIEINSSQFCVAPVNFPVSCNPPTTGTYTDIISTDNDIIVGPPGGTDPDSVMQAFDPVGLTGVGSFLIDSGAMPGASDAGQIVLTYTLTNLDPNDPNAVVLGTGLILSADASITVSQPLPPPMVPEPATAGLLGSALLALLADAPRRRKQRKVKLTLNSRSRWWRKTLLWCPTDK